MILIFFFFLHLVLTLYLFLFCSNVVYLLFGHFLWESVLLAWATMGLHEMIYEHGI